MRVSHVSILSVGLVLSSCGNSEEQAAAPSRFEAVTQTQNDPSAAYCDVHSALGQGPSFVFPETTGDAPRRGAGFTWVNLWATWCQPCVEEIPLLKQWQARLAQENISLTPVFLSVDASDQEIATFRQTHPEMPSNTRIATPQALSELARSVGIQSASGIPIHILLDPQGKVRCVRQGAVRENDLDRVKAILKAR